MITYLNKTDVQLIIEVSGESIRKFLASADEHYFKGDAQAAIRTYKSNPILYSNQALIAMGAHIDQAHKNPVRIELRGVNHLGAAQVVAKGVWGQQREENVTEMRKVLNSRGCHLLVRTAGSSSFEFNQWGVDKSLPLHYLRVAWSKVLDQMQYEPGQLINARSTRTVIAADGDGTIYDGPRTTHLPLLKDSVVFPSLLRYLENGGIFMLVSGNDVNRTFKRLIDGLPKAYYQRVLLSANGGADLVTVDPDGYPVFDLNYRNQALSLIQQKQQMPTLDIVYIGDDGSPLGNDRAAFEAVGFDRSVLVAESFEKVFDPLLLPVYIGKNINGTKSFLDVVNAWMVKHPHQPVFNDAAQFCKRVVSYES